VSEQRETSGQSPAAAVGAPNREPMRLGTPATPGDKVKPPVAPARPRKRRSGNDFHRAAARVQALQSQLEARPDIRVSPQALAALAVTIGLMIATWWHALTEMWFRWFPGWINTAMPLTDRLTMGDSYYTHGPLVPMASAIIAYMIYKRVGLPCHRTRGSALFGTAAMAFSLLVQVVAARADVTFLAGFAMLGVMISLLVLWGGWGMLRAYWLPILFLVFMVPLPMDTVAKINFQLKTVAGDSALWLTSHVFGVAAIREGSTVYLPDDKTLVIENVCSGLRSLISLICFASLFALICRVKGMWRLFLLLMAVPVAIATNVLRITLMNLAAYYQGVEVAGPGGWAHDFSGIFVFALALAIMFGLEWCIIKLSKVLKRDWTDPRLLGYLDELPKTAGQHLRMVRPVPMLGLALVAYLSTSWALEPPSPHKGEMASRAVPTTVFVDGERFDRDGPDREMDVKTLTILQTNDYLYRAYISKRSGERFDVSVVFSANNRKGTHPPEVCLEGGGARVVSKQVHDVTLPADPGRRGEITFRMRELVTEHNGVKQMHLYTFKCGSSYTPDFFWQQMTIFLNAFVDRNTAGALIRFDVPIVNDNEDDARALVLRAAKAVMQEVDRGLP
jgi:EpsI family protein